MDDEMGDLMEIPQFSPEWWERIHHHSSKGRSYAQEVHDRLQSEVSISHHPKLVKAQNVLKELLSAIEPLAHWIESSKHLGITEVSDEEKGHFTRHMGCVSKFYLTTGPIQRDVLPVLNDGLFFNFEDQKALSIKANDVRFQFAKVLWMIL